MIDPRLDAALEVATEKARLFTADTLAGEYVDGWRQAIEALRAEHESRRFTQNGECGGEFCTSCKTFRDFCNAMVRE